MTESWWSCRLIWRPGGLILWRILWLLRWILRTEAGTALAETAVDAAGIYLAGSVAAYGTGADIRARKRALHFLTRIVYEIPFVVMGFAVHHLDSFRFVSADHANDGASAELHWRITAGREAHGTCWLSSGLCLSKAAGLTEAACLASAAWGLSGSRDRRLSHGSGL